MRFYGVRFPVNVHTAPKEDLLRIPGIGVRSVKRMIAARRCHRLRLDDLSRLSVALTRAMPFIETANYTPGRLGPDSAHLCERARINRQLDVLSAATTSARTREL